MKLWYSMVEHDFSDRGLANILEEVTIKKPTEVVLLSETEWEISRLFRYFVDALRVLNTNLIIVYGSDDGKFYDTFRNRTGLEKTNIQFWPTHWINWTLLQLKFNSSYPNVVDPNNFIYPFISLNNRSHYHRCVFIDELAKNNLIASGVVTWVKHLNENIDYPYQYFDNRKLLLGDGFDRKLDSFLIPNEFNQSLFHFVTEATDKVVFITEKTAIPIFMKKPFVSLGSKGFNKKLLELGFKLYDEIIDYKFDSIDDVTDRTAHFVKNIKTIVNCNLQEIYYMLKPKIEFNFNHAIDIAKSVNFIPDIIKERYAISKENPTMKVDYRYKSFMDDSFD